MAIKWEKQWSREFSFYKMETATVSLFSNWAKKFLGRRLKNILFFKDGNNSVLYVDKDEIEKGLNFLYNLACTNWGSFKDFINFHLHIEKKFLKFSQNINKTELSKLDNKSLAKFLEKFLIVQTGHSLISQWGIFYLAEMLPEKIQKAIRQTIKDPNKIEEYIEIIFTPSHHNQIIKEHLDLVRLAVDYKHRKINKNKLNKAFEKHTLKYQWIPVIDILDEPWDKKQFEKEFRKILKKNPQKELSNTIKELKNRKKNWQQLIKEKKWNSKQKLLFKIAHSITFYKDGRDDKRRKAYFNLSKLYREIAKRLKISLKELSFLMHREIILSLKGNLVPRSLIKKRQKFFLIIIKNQRFKIFTGKQGEDLLKKTLKEKNRSRNQQISGKIASRGITGGVARIIKTKSDLVKIKSGNVMVAITTHPDFVPTMRKCNAVITDEGGAMCHAAIVARELKIPCIIGTKIATVVLRDGDLVEVDANKGVVRKISKR